MKNKGISLITLVITIVVVIILAAAVILSLGKNNPINQARVATVTGTKDNVESSILTYSSSIKAKTLGQFSTEEILITNDSYKIVVTGSTANITVDGNPKTLYKINIAEAKSKLNIELKEETNAAWYVDNLGKTYLVYVNKPSIPSYLMENDEVLSSIRGFVTYADAVIETPITPGTNPTDPTETGKYSAKDIFDMSDTEKQSVIGKSVTNVNSTNGWNNWKVFSSDGTNIMLIAGDYVKIDSTNFPSGYSFTKVNGSDYKVNSDYSRDNLLSSLEGTTQSTTFDGFKDSAGKVTEARIPTIQDFALSYNAVEHSGTTYTDSNHTSGYPLIQKVYYKSGANSGYDVAAGSSTVTSNDTVPAGSYWTNYGLPRTDYGNLWVIEDSTKADGYWLASASSAGTGRVISVKCYGCVDNPYYKGSYAVGYDGNHRGLRPVVILESSVKLVQNIDGSNITYTLE